MASRGAWQEDRWRQEDMEEWLAQWWKRDEWSQSSLRDYWHEQRLHQPDDEDDGWQGMTAAMLERNARVTATSPLSHQWAYAKAASKVTATSSVMAHANATPLSHNSAYFRAVLKAHLEAPAESAPSEPGPWKVIADLLAETAPEEKPNPEVTSESAACKSETVPEEKQ